MVRLVFLLPHNIGLSYLVLVCPFFPFLLVIVLFVFRFMASDYPFAIFKFFLNYVNFLWLGQVVYCHTTWVRKIWSTHWWWRVHIYALCRLNLISVYVHVSVHGTLISFISRQNIIHTICRDRRDKGLCLYLLVYVYYLIEAIYNFESSFKWIINVKFVLSVSFEKTIFCLTSMVSDHVFSVSYFIRLIFWVR